jgi:IS5 family transposase
MRTVIDPQWQLGEQDIGAIWLDPKSRDDIPQILLGLQHIYTTPEVRAKVFAILEEMLPERRGEGKSGKASPDAGRPGMSQWRILVLGLQIPSFFGVMIELLSHSEDVLRSRLLSEHLGKSANE